MKNSEKKEEKKKNVKPIEEVGTKEHRPKTKPGGG
jgi:hypothetical protein